MGFSDGAQEAPENGANAAKAGVADALVEQQPFMRAFIRMCKDGFDQGWHEANGGNLTYRMTEEDVAACQDGFTFDRPWVEMGVQADNLKGAYFLTTGSGKYMRNVPLHPADCLGIVEINEAGDAWRIVWGLENGGTPESTAATKRPKEPSTTPAISPTGRFLYVENTPARPTRAKAMG